MEPHIRIFPCGDEFPSPDALVTWLLVALRGRGGHYHLRSGNAAAALPAGSIVLFRHGDVIVGEAVVRDYSREPGTDRSLTGNEESFGARVTFAPDTIRVFAPPILLADVQRAFGPGLDITVPRGYYIAPEWAAYPRLLAAHIGQGGRFM